MEWLDWNDEAFSTARARGCPVLLFVMAGWCRWCRKLEKEVLSDPAIAKRIQDDFVAIRVDKDRRPDIDPRYTMGGWPTLAWLDENGDILGADNFLDKDQLAKRLEEVSDGYAQGADVVRELLNLERRASHDGLPATPPPSKAALGQKQVELSLEIVDKIGTSVLETADPIYGGWGKQHKFPHPEAIDFALIRWTQTGDARMLDLVRRTLRRMQAGEIHDKVEGGFYRYATQADWSAPNTEKMLDSNAQRLFIFVEAYQAFGEEEFKDSAIGGLEWMDAALFDPKTKAFRGSQDANTEYAHLPTKEAREKRGRPPVDDTVFTNWNAMAVSTLLKASTVLNSSKWRDRALDTLDFLMTEMWDDERGMHHYYDGRRHLPGMLSDQAYTLRALIDAAQFAGENRYLADAEKLANFTIESLRADNNGFYDKAHDPQARGGLRRRNRSILENSVMAEALLRLSLLTGERDYEDSAREALASFTGTYLRFGHYVAGYARAVDLLFHQPFVVTVVGAHNSKETLALMRAALQPYVASRVVRNVDPVRDPELFKRSHLPLPKDGPRAYVERGRESYADTSDPKRLPALMMRT
ncbi:MAG: hypothetical protein ACI8X5_002275 [Planctomycetota bacterium]|jgi:uncharacterized protein YyaL (SSP411 family)